MVHRTRALSGSALLAALACSGASAQAPVCGPETAGIVACIAGHECACGFVRGSAATGLPDGFRWDCGILRPRCAPPPAAIDGRSSDLPAALLIDNARPAHNISPVDGGLRRSR
ncbi:MAG: hypothetical protein AB7I59_26650 [Geminicoccaceae bacterium]